MAPILTNDKKELYAYMGSIIKDSGSIPILINGMSDHVHILCIMSKNIALAKLTEEIKRHSSRWIKTNLSQASACEMYYTNNSITNKPFCPE
jgi:REP element-mobilizing transposase RayT